MKNTNGKTALSSDIIFQYPTINKVMHACTPLLSSDADTTNFLIINSIQNLLHYETTPIIKRNKEQGVIGGKLLTIEEKEGSGDTLL